MLFLVSLALVAYHCCVVGVVWGLLFENYIVDASILIFYFAKVSMDPFFFGGCVFLCVFFVDHRLVKVFKGARWMPWH